MSNLHPKPPEIVYKYRNWSDKFHRRLITHGEVYFADLKEFNDPFDNAIPFRYSEMTESEFVKNQEIIARSQGYKIPPQLKPVFRKDYTKAFQNEDLKQYEDDSRNRFQEKFKVFCSSKTARNIQQWSYYANAHRGFCVGLNVKYFLEITQYIFTVSYPEEFPLLNPCSVDQYKNYKKALCTKSKNWAHEEEIRVLSSKLKGTYKLDPKAIEEVYLGLNMGIGHKASLIASAIKRNPNTRFYEVKKAEYKFKLEKRRLDADELKWYLSKQSLFKRMITYLKWQSN